MKASVENLYIKDFGPIREANIDVRDLTVLVGPQATGKSLTAQTFYFLRGMEELLLPDSYAAGSILASNLAKAPEIEERLNNAFTFWLGTNAPALSHRATLLRWQCPGQGVHEIRYAYDPSGSPPTSQVNDALRSRIKQSPETRPAGSTEAQVYIPAGRVLYSFISPSQALYLLTRTKVEWPGYVNLFYEKLSDSIKRLFEHGREHGWKPPERTPLMDKQEAILRGKLLHSDMDRIMLSVEDALAGAEGYSRSFGFDPLKLASGQMETWPFFTVVQAALLSSPAPATRIYFEEPEAHLHPVAQRELMEVIAGLTRERLRFVLTTHSPYVIYALNNFLMAHKVLQAGRTLPAAVPVEAALAPGSVSAYRFTRDGRVVSLMDDETGLLRTDELDEVAGEMGALFTDMQERLEGHE